MFAVLYYYKYTSRGIHNAFLGHLSNSGDLLLWVGVHFCPSCVNIFFSRTTGQSLPKLVCRICRVRRQEIVNFMTPTP